MTYIYLFGLTEIQIEMIALYPGFQALIIILAFVLIRSAVKKDLIAGWF